MICLRLVASLQFEIKPGLMGFRRCPTVTVGRATVPKAVAPQFTTASSPHLLRMDDA